MHSSTSFLHVILWSTVLLGASASFAGNGKLSGSMKGAGTGLPVQGNVELLGTTMGVSADSTGRFVLVNVPPGTYTLLARAIGWKPLTVEGITLYEDQVRTITLTLFQQEIVLSETVVEADRPGVDPSKTSAWTRFDRASFTDLPVRSADQVVRLSAASFGGSVRGGRPYQTVTIIDGLDVTDRFEPWYRELTGNQTRNAALPIVALRPTPTGSAGFEPRLEAIDQGTLFAGTWGPEYAGVSGAVSYKLREGRERWSGTANFRMSQPAGQKHLGPDVYNDQAAYLYTRDTSSSSTRELIRWRSQYFTWNPGSYEYGTVPEYDGGIGFGGPIGEDVGLYLSAGWFDTHGRLPAVHYRQLSGSAKLTASLGASARINATLLLEDRGLLFGWKNRPYIDFYRYFLEAVPRTDGLSLVGGVKFTKMLSPTAYYEILLSVNSRKDRTGYCDGNNDGWISLEEEGEFLTWEDTAQVNRYQATSDLRSDPKKFFAVTGIQEMTTTRNTVLVAGPRIRYTDISTQVYSGQLSFSASLGAHHTLSGGARASLHRYDYLSRLGGGDYPRYRNYVEENWTLWPRELNVYIQDRMEYDGLTVNAGFRVDVYDPRGSDYADWYHPFRQGTSPAGTPLLIQVRGEQVPIHGYFSPRFGVAHPVGERLVVHFSLSMAHEPFPYGIVFREYEKDAWVSGLSRVSQEPQRSTSYDLGVQWAPVDDLIIDANLYQKDYLNSFGPELGARPVILGSGSPLGSVPVFTSHGSVLARGIEMSMQLSPVDIAGLFTIGGRGTYTYSYAKAGLETGQNQMVFSVQAGDSAKYGGTLPFDDFTRWNKVFIQAPGGPSNFLAGYDREHRFTLYGTLALPWDIRLSFTGRFASGFFYPVINPATYVFQVDEGPWNKQIDVRLEKGFAISDHARLALYVDISNIFNWSNVVSVYGDTSVNDEYTAAWVQKGDPTGGPNINRPVTSWDGTLLFDVPREFSFGVRLTL
jgi:hypothetical protein